MKKKVSFNSLIQSNKPVLVDFTAQWCGPCRAMGPILQEVASDLGDKASIVKVDVDKNPELASQLGIMGVPTFILYKKGKAHWRHSGMHSAKALKEVIEQAIAS